VTINKKRTRLPANPIQIQKRINNYLFLTPSLLPRCMKLRRDLNPLDVSLTDYASICEFFLKQISIATSTLVDPYLITNNFDNSLISKDDSFKRTTMPEPVLKRRESVNHHSALDLPEPTIMVAHHQPEPELPEVNPPVDPTIQLHDDKNSITTTCTCNPNSYYYLFLNLRPKHFVITSQPFKSSTSISSSSTTRARPCS
jgi:hypothetical protein